MPVNPFQSEDAAHGHAVKPEHIQAPGPREPIPASAGNKRFGYSKKLRRGPDFISSLTSKAGAAAPHTDLTRWSLIYVLRQAATSPRGIQGETICIPR